MLKTVFYKNNFYQWVPRVINVYTKYQDPPPPETKADFFFYFIERCLIDPSLFVLEGSCLHVCSN